MRTGPDGIALIKHFEGLELTAYYCPAGVATVGYGHTGSVTVDGRHFPTVQYAMDALGHFTISEADAETLLMQDLQHYEDGVSRYVKVPLQQHQFDALVSFAYNLGLGALKESTLLKRVNAGRFADAAEQFGRWVYADGRQLEGLVKRRAAEAKLFLTGEWA